MVKEIIIDDTIAFRGRFSSVCSHCKHNGKPMTYECKAFDMIPEVIWMGDNDHRKPYPGDNGIQFEPIELDEGII